jgi:SnoaL-like domain
LSKLSVTDGPAFTALMKRYVVDYTNSHDQAETFAIMEPDYVLHMGEYVVRGRDEAYRAAAAKQIEQFPGLMLTVHEIATSGERLVMRFSEHGASRLHDNRRCCWGGIGLYLWNGRRLVRNFVEQDYFSRRSQLSSGVSNSVETPAVAPWDTVAVAPNAAAEQVTRAWLESGALASTSGVLMDDQWTGAAAPVLIDQTAIDFNDFFSCGSTVAFHVTQHGVLRPNEQIKGSPGTTVFMHMAGLVHVLDARVISGRIVRNRLDFSRRIGKG